MGVCWKLTEELRKTSRLFFEFVLPAIGMIEEKNDLVVRIDLPGFIKENINLRIVEDILTINAKREEKQEEQKHEEKRTTLAPRHHLYV